MNIENGKYILGKIISISKYNEILKRAVIHFVAYQVMLY